MNPTIIFDFDGTVAVGDGPVRAFARFAAESAGADYLERVGTALADYDRGSSSFRDGYDVVGTLARTDGVDEATLSAAYAHSRTRLGTADAPVQAAEGLAELLAELDPRVRVVLATNAPEDGIPALLVEWGIADRFTATHFVVGKPAGLGALVTEALEHGPVLSIGDIFVNDLAPAHELGADTALVGATAATSPEQPTFRAAALSELVPDIRRWADDALRAPDPAS
ncbi:HAD family hydrolase [Microbacterium sp. ARD32]|uniref:HAD family hydrolase n=1 Tax=Microbacterium sp. ARD32 TaxID=2962577 RepID=UPI002881B76C|nr:HAD family hydrolase [Microbacterium sp. ARD32]MDT0158702.1 HAD family hydrolase [Microbacterium sp. ARD32]